MEQIDYTEQKRFLEICLHSYLFPLNFIEVRGVEAPLKCCSFERVKINDGSVFLSSMV